MRCSAAVLVVCAGSVVGLGCDAPSRDAADLPNEPAPADESPVEAAARRWPLVRALAAQAEGTRLATSSAGRVALAALASDLRAELDPADGSLTLAPRSAPLPLRVRRVDAPLGATVDGPVVTLTGATHDALFVPSPRGVEELVVVREPGAPLRYELDLPAGFTVAHDGAAAITVSDPAGRPVARGLFFSGWDASGARFAPSLAIEGASVEVALDPELAYPLLIDPEWVDAAVPVYPRLHGGLTLLSDGRVLVTGGYELGDAPSEIYDPDLGVFRTVGPPLPPRQHHSATLMRDGAVLLAGGTTPDGDDATTDPVIASVDRFDPATGTVTGLGALDGWGAGHTATRLDDGSVLLAGGVVSAPDEDPVGMTAAYRVAEDGTIARVGDLQRLRGHHTASRLPDGNVLIAGGRTFSPNPDGVPTVHASMELFDPATNSFSLAPETMTFARADHVATVFDDGRLMVGWGRSAYTCNEGFELHAYAGGSLTELDTHDGGGCLSEGTPLVQLPYGDWLSDMRWSWIKDVLNYGTEERFLQPSLFDGLPYGPAGSSYAPLGHGGVLALAKGLAYEHPLRFARDPLPAEVVPYGEDVLRLDEGLLSEEHGRSALAPLSDGRLLIVGGRHLDHEAEIGEDEERPYVYVYTATLFDPISKSESEPIPVAKGRIGHTATRLDDGRVLVTGGSNRDEDTRPSELFDPHAMAFTLGPALALERARHTATRLADGRVLIVGGTLEDGHVELFDPRSDDIDVGAELEQARTDHAAVRLMDGRVALLGGYVAPDTPTASVEVFDPASGELSPLGSLRVPRAGHTAALLPSGKVLVAGGAGFDGVQTSLELFDPSTGLSTPAGEKPGGMLTKPTITLLPDGILLAGGGKTATGSACYFDAVTGAPPGLRFFSVCGDHRLATLDPSGNALLLTGEGTGRRKNMVPGEYGRSWTLLGREGLEGGPFITSYPPVVAVGTTVTLSGERFAALSEGASGSTRQSAGDVPLVEWMPLDGGPGARGTVTRWTDTSLEWTVPDTAFHGPGYLWVVTRGKRSHAALVRIVAANQGTPCDDDDDCSTGVCRDAVCCDRPCGECEACSATAKGFGVDGVCEPLVEGSAPLGAAACPVEPVSTCGRTGFCDGAGACALVSDGTECVEGATCQAGDCVVLEPTCDGDHQILEGDAFLGDCAPYRCSMVTHSCLTACESNLDCSDDFVCDEASECAPRIDPPAAPQASCTAAPPSSASLWPSAAALLALSAARRRRRARGRT